MNKYEEKFKKGLTSVFSSIEYTKNRGNELVKELVTTNMEVQALRDSIKQIENPTAIKALEEALKQKTKRQEIVQAAILANNTSGLKVEDKLRFLQELCPHIDSVYDSTDYHKNEDFRKCTLCTKVY